MNTMQFEALKVALKQDKTGYVLTLCMHPDEIPTCLLRDFVGARYQVVMVRLDDHQNPMEREDSDGERSIKIAGILCREKQFWKYLNEDSQILTPTEKEATNWLREYLGVKSRSELKTNQEARNLLDAINKEYKSWNEKT
jgi:hypothetical protein